MVRYPSAFAICVVCCWWISVSAFQTCSSTTSRALFRRKSTIRDDQQGGLLRPRTLSQIVGAAALSFMIVTSSGNHFPAYAAEDQLVATPVITRADVGPINLNTEEPPITDVCWLDFLLEGTDSPRRVEISMYGTVVPATVSNFKALAKNGYTGSEVFRIINEFSVQAGNIGISDDTPGSRRGRFGRAADNQPFAPENFRILHNFKDAGVVSMMKDQLNGGLQDSRFFITLKEDASWADDRYTAFGRVTRGMDFIQSLIAVPVTPPANYPQSSIKIVGSGVY